MNFFLLNLRVGRNYITMIFFRMGVGAGGGEGGGGPSKKMAD